MDGGIAIVVSGASCTDVQRALEALSAVNLCQWRARNTGDMVEMSTLCDSTTSCVGVSNSAHAALMCSCTASAAQTERLTIHYDHQYDTTTDLYNIT